MGMSFENGLASRAQVLRTSPTIFYGGIVHSHPDSRVGISDGENWSKFEVGFNDVVPFPVLGYMSVVVFLAKGLLVDRLIIMNK